MKPATMRLCSVQQGNHLKIKAYRLRLHPFKNAVQAAVSRVPALTGTWQQRSFFVFRGSHTSIIPIQQGSTGRALVAQTCPW